LYRADCSQIGVRVSQCHTRGEKNLGRPKKRLSEAQNPTCENDDDDDDDDKKKKKTINDNFFYYL
jgi:hypothetical protein